MRKVIFAFGLGALCLAILVAAVPASAQTYDMLQYLTHSNQKKANVIWTNIGVSPVWRGFCPGNSCPSGGGQLFITKNWNGSGATDFEEFVYDSSYIYLVRDTSWQSYNFCNGQETSFELWTGNRNRGKWFPRYVQSGKSYFMGNWEVRARKEGNGCGSCDSPADSNGQQNASRTIYVQHYGAISFPTVGTLNDILQISVTAGSGAGETYYFSKSLGWVGYSDPNLTAYYSSPANSGNDFEVAPIDPCAGATGCTYYQSRASNVYHQIGRAYGYDWSASTWWDRAGFMSYGPYDTKWGSGTHKAWFYLQIDNNTANNDVVATVDVVTNSGANLLASRQIRRRDFTKTYSWQAFGLDFDNPSLQPTEVRVYWHDRAWMLHAATYICK